MNITNNTNENNDTTLEQSENTGGNISVFNNEDAAYAVGIVYCK